MKRLTLSKIVSFSDFCRAGLGYGALRRFLFSVLFVSSIAVVSVAGALEIAGAAEHRAGGVKPESLDALYQKAKKDGRVVIYAASSTNTEQIVFPAFEKRFPGITVNHVNATADKLVARVIAEARGGKILADVVSGTMNYITQLKEQNLLADLALSEAIAYAAALKGPYWVATDTEYFIAAWNAARLKKGDEPK